MLASITNDQFNHAADQFLEVLVHHLVSTDGTLKVLNHYVKSVSSLNKNYLTLKLQHQSQVIDVLVSYDDFYTVPVCYFNIYNATDNQLVKERVTDSSKVTLDSHPLTNEVWSVIHPCETLQGIKDFLTDADLILGYLIIWFGVYGLPSVITQISLRVRAEERETEKV